LIPPGVENVEVLVVKLIPLVFPTENIDPGEVAPMPTLPFVPRMRAFSKTSDHKEHTVAISGIELQSSAEILHGIV